MRSTRQVAYCPGTFSSTHFQSAFQPTRFLTHFLAPTDNIFTSCTFYQTNDATEATRFKRSFRLTNDESSSSCGNALSTVISCTFTTSKIMSNAQQRPTYDTRQNGIQSQREATTNLFTDAMKLADEVKQMLVRSIRSYSRRSKRSQMCFVVKCPPIDAIKRENCR